MKKLKILGVAGSLRNARYGLGQKQLIEELKNLKTELELNSFLYKEANLHLQNFVEAGRKDGLPFDEIYKNLKKNTGNKGLSNSEVALSASLWAVWNEGVDIDNVSLADFFKSNGTTKDLDKLKERVLDCDGIILSTPVYFGDRGSLAQSFLDFIRNDEDLIAKAQEQVYAGISVGAKRNGGQETTLIFQMFDMVNAGFYAVGNDSATTSQYGGTGYAGDVGSMAADEYGLLTSRGTGRRIASVVKKKALGDNHNITDAPKVNFLVLQDKEDIALGYVKKLVEDLGPGKINAQILKITDKHVKRCIACDICPTHIDIDQEYRCIIPGSKADDMADLHETMIDADVIVPVVYSSIDGKGLQSNYQNFVERTRYIRRGDYVWSNLIVSPLVVEELGGNHNWQTRLMTSFIRHHTVMLKPSTIYLQGTTLLNYDMIVSNFENNLKKSLPITAGRIIVGSGEGESITYNPFGYTISYAKEEEDQKFNRRSKAISDRVQRASNNLKKRIEQTK